MSKTSIPLDTETRDRLRTYGQKGETWDETLNHLMDLLDSKGTFYRVDVSDMPVTIRPVAEVSITTSVRKRPGEEE